MSKVDEPIEFPAPIPGQEASQYVALTKEIAHAAVANALIGIRSNDSEVALDAISDGIRLLLSIVEFAKDAGSDRANDVSLGPASLNPQFGGMAAMHSLERKRANARNYKPSPDTSPAELNSTTASKAAHASIVRLRSYRKRVRELAPQMRARADQNPNRTAGG